MIRIDRKYLLNAPFAEKCEIEKRNIVCHFPVNIFVRVKMIYLF